jgi:hypothetical protein
MGAALFCQKAEELNPQKSYNIYVDAVSSVTYCVTNNKSASPTGRRIGKESCKSSLFLLSGLGILIMGLGM